MKTSQNFIASTLYQDLQLQQRQKICSSLDFVELELKVDEGRSSQWKSIFFLLESLGFGKPYSVFKEGQLDSLKLTLRGDKMWIFLSTFIQQGKAFRGEKKWLSSNHLKVTVSDFFGLFQTDTFYLYVSKDVPVSVNIYGKKHLNAQVIGGFRFPLQK